jgi:hypothetical protein
MLNKKLQEIIGPLPKESGFMERMRYHQTWWRSSVFVQQHGDVSRDIRSGRLARST